MSETVYRTCTLCEATCGLKFEVEDNTIVSVRPDDDDVFSKGYVCPKGIAIGEIHHDPDRLRTPMRRQADGTFEPISWDEAFDLVGRRLTEIRDRHGSDAIGFYWGNPLGNNHGAILMLDALSKAIGTKNRFSAGSQDANPRLVTSMWMYGSSVSAPIPDIDRTDYFLCIGANPVISNGSVMTAPDMKGRLRAVQRTRRQGGGRSTRVAPRPREWPTSSSPSARAPMPRLLLAMAQCAGRNTVAPTTEFLETPYHGLGRRSRACSSDFRAWQARRRVHRRRRGRDHRAASQLEFAERPLGRSPTLALACASPKHATACHLRDRPASTSWPGASARDRRCPCFPVAAFDMSDLAQKGRPRRPRPLAKPCARPAREHRRSALDGAGRGDRDPRRRPDPRDGHVRRQPGAIGARMVGALPAAFEKLDFMVVDRHLPQRDHAPCRHRAAAVLDAGRGPRRPALQSGHGPQRSPAGRRRSSNAKMASWPTGRSCWRMAREPGRRADRQRHVRSRCSRWLRAGRRSGLGAHARRRSSCLRLGPVR